MLLIPAPTPQELRAAYRAGVARYIGERRRKITPFVRETYSLRSSLALHREALREDFWRAPTNVMLAVPQLAMDIGAAGASRLGWRQASEGLRRRRLPLDTAAGRALTWRVMTRFLELPFESPDGRVSTKDALGEAILREPPFPALLAPLDAALAGHRDPEALQRWLTDALTHYAESRTHAADLTNALLAGTAGALFFKQFTPGAISLGPLLTQAIAQKMAPLWLPLGGKLMGLLPASLLSGSLAASVPAAATAGTTLGLLGIAAVVASCSGIVTDPLQARLGLHRYRLRRLIDRMERSLLGQEQAAYSLPDRYAARLLDLLDLARSFKTA
ncbi:MAG: hypothetical protein GDA41_03225 [Rhodospirillales bacterium]|nr:hypothetical protein [Rhodospirillales bacterium]